MQRLKGNRVRIPNSPAAVSGYYRICKVTGHSSGRRISEVAKSEDLPMQVVFHLLRGRKMDINEEQFVMKGLEAFILMILFGGGASASEIDTLKTWHIDEVSIDARRMKHEATSTAPLHILSRKDIGRLGITDIAEALHRMPGVMLRDYGGAGGLKTVSVRGFGAQHTGVVYDGIMLSECQSGEIDLSRYSLNNVDMLSLVVGDNDDIFIPARQASMASVLTIQSVGGMPDDRKIHLETDMKVGSFGYVSPFFRYTQRLSRNMALSLAGEYTHVDNKYPFILTNLKLKTKEHRTNSRMNSGHTEANLIWRTGLSDYLRAKIYYYDNDRKLPGQVRLYTSLSGETLHDRNVFAQVQWQGWNRKGNLGMKFNGKFNWAASIYKDRLMPHGVKDASYWQREYYSGFCLLYHPVTNWNLDYSVDYAFNNLNSSLETDNHPYRHTVLQSATAKYATERFIALARLLYSLYFNDTQTEDGAKDMHQLSPSLSLSYRLYQQLYIRASYKNIFRAPTFNESYYFHYGSTTLDPEKTNQLNIGITWEKHWNNRRLSTRLFADGYVNHIRDKIVAVPYNMFVWTNINVGKVDSKGLELTLKADYRLTTKQQLTLNGNWNYQRVANRTSKSSQYYGYQIAYQPLHTGSFAIGWENPWVNLTVHGTGMSSRWANNNHYEGTEVDGYWEFGATVWKSIRYKNQSWTARLDVMNLLNKQYEIVSHYPMPGINWKLSMNCKF